jgi:hypothetical protein
MSAWPTASTAATLSVAGDQRHRAGDGLVVDERLHAFAHLAEFLRIEAVRALRKAAGERVDGERRRRERRW